MEQTVIMQRKLFNGYIRQDSKNGFLNANDLVKLGNQWRISNKLKVFNFSSWKASGETK